MNSDNDTTPEQSDSLTGAVVGIVDDGSVENKVELPYNIWVQELKLKGQEVKDYSYNYQSDYLNSNGLIISKPTYYVFIKGNLARKVYPGPIKGQGQIYYDNVYLDDVLQTAYGVCRKTGITCSELKGKYFPLVYAEQKMEITPVGLVSKLDRYSKATGQISYANRQVTYVESELTDGKVERLYVDEFFGLPVHQEIFIMVDGKELVLEEREFSRISAGKGAVSTKDVVLPEELVLLE